MESGAHHFLPLLVYNRVIMSENDKKIDNIKIRLCFSGTRRKRGVFEVKKIYLVQMIFRYTSYFLICTMIITNGFFTISSARSHSCSSLYAIARTD